MIYIIEFEGFALTRSFIFKEVTVAELSSNKFISLFVKSPFPRRNLSVAEKRIVGYCEERLHKIYWNSGSHQIQDVRKIFSTISKSDTVYTKGRQKVEILKSNLNTDNVFDLEELGCKNVSVYRKEINACPCKLRRHYNNYHCSFFKAQAFRHFLLEHESIN